MLAPYYQFLLEQSGVLKKTGGGGGGREREQAATECFGVQILLAMSTWKPFENVGRQSITLLNIPMLAPRHVRNIALNVCAI